jgi:hypothetical protein
VSVLDRIYQAGRRLDRKVSASLGLDRLAAWVRSKLPEGITALGARWGPPVAFILVIALYAAAFASVNGDRGQETQSGADGFETLGDGDLEPGEEGGEEVPEEAGEAPAAGQSPSGLSDELQEAFSAAPRTEFEAAGPGALPSWATPGRPFNPAEYGPRNSWPGVTDKKIRVLFHMTKQSCGDNYSALVSQVLNFSAQWEHTILPIVAYFNARADKLYANNPNEATYFPRGTLYGRVIEPILEFDDGGPYCEDKARQNGDKAFQGGYGGPVLGAIGAGYGAERFIAENMIGPCVNDPNKRCPMHVGAFWHTDGWYNQRRPYAWAHWSSSTRIVQGVASWTAHRQQASGGEVEYSPQFEGQQRKFGFIAQDQPEDRRTVQQLITQLRNYGVRQPGDIPGTTRDFDPAVDVIFTPTVLSGRQQAMAQACAYFKVNGYTTIFHQGSVLDPIFLFPACTGQDYRPEWPISSKGYFDVGTAGRSYWDLDPAPSNRKQMLNARGVSTLLSSRTIATRPENTPPGQAWRIVCPFDPNKPHHPMCPKDDDGNWVAGVPDDLNIWYYPLNLLHSTMAASGPALTPFNGERYMEEVCNPCPPNAYIIQLLKYSRSDHTSIDDHVAWLFDPTRRDPSADMSDWEDADTPPEGGYRPDGSVRNGRRCLDFRDPATCR